MRPVPVEEDSNSGSVGLVSQRPMLRVPLQVLGRGLEEAIMVRMQAACTPNSLSTLSGMHCGPSGPSPASRETSDCHLCHGAHIQERAGKDAHAIQLCFPHVQASTSYLAGT